MEFYGQTNGQPVEVEGTRTRFTALTPPLPTSISFNHQNPMASLRRLVYRFGSTFTAHRPIVLSQNDMVRGTSPGLLS